MTYTPPAPTEGVNGASYELKLDIAPLVTSPTVPSWLVCPDITALQPNPQPKTADGATYANRGQDAPVALGEGFTLGYDVKVVRNSEGKVAPYLGLLLAASNATLPGGDPTKKIIMARAYHEWIEELAWEFTAEVSFQRKNTGNADVEFLSFTLTAQGDRKVIANPALDAPSAPTVTSATPAGAEEGAWVEILGTGFANATAVTFGGDPATSFLLATGGRLFAQMPEGDAGSAPVIVTTPVGSSAPFAYTRGA